ncbi:HEAT repeat-containing protein 6 [Caerostris extrusa]|uniref:HEAT repeat-containing protein 6 n=1 Tax=Caerostris extrusa TaxID=172846 RepID=A0AAV4NX05_CAEEX|nr:HEAT repeat-containing protein 6 [Caerostris extrusa]
MNSDQIPVEIQDLMLSSDSNDSAMKANNSLNNESSDDYSLPWIIELCKDNILNEEPLPIQIQSLQLLCSVVGKCFQKSYFIHNYFFTLIEDIVFFCLNDQDISIQLHGAKLLDIVGRSVNIVTDVEFRKALESAVSILWWNILMGTAFLKCLTNDDAKTLQFVCCDCLSTLPCSGFEKLPPRSQITYLTILLGLTSDSNPNVRGAAIRCLGLYCLFPSLIQDASFLEDVSSILIKSVDDSNVNVRFKASWSLGNLCDALFVNKDEILRNEAISPTFFFIQ